MRIVEKRPIKFYSGLSAVSLALLVIGLAACQSSVPEESLRIYVGTWTSGGGGDGEEGTGIYMFNFDKMTGALSSRRRVAPATNPSYLTFTPDGKHLYSVNQTTDSASVSAFEVDKTTGAITLLNEVVAGGASPCYISTDRAGEWVLVANYASGTVALFPVRTDGSLGQAVDVVQHTGSSVDPDRQAAPHAHYIDVSPDNRFALASDLGTDQVLIYPLDTERGHLNEQGVRKVATSPGTGPRHLDFHPNGRYVYLVGELSGAVTTYHYNAKAGRMEELQTISALPEGFEGANKSADIHVHPSGNFLYVSNRGDFDSIVVYEIDPKTNTLSLVGWQEESIQWPRNFAIDPSGQFLLVANRRANRITVFRIDPDTGALTFTGRSATVPEPMCIKFLVIQ